MTDTTLRKRDILLRSFIAIISAVSCLLVSCDHSIDLASQHLRALGYKDVACEAISQGSALCLADGAHLRCASTHAEGCAPDNTTACERFYLEKPAL